MVQTNLSIIPEIRCKDNTFFSKMQIFMKKMTKMMKKCSFVEKPHFSVNH